MTYLISKGYFPANTEKNEFSETVSCGDSGLAARDLDELKAVGVVEETLTEDNVHSLEVSLGSVPVVGQGVLGLVWPLYLYLNLLGLLRYIKAGVILVSIPPP